MELFTDMEDGRTDGRTDRQGKEDEKVCTYHAEWGADETETFAIEWCIIRQK